MSNPFYSLLNRPKTIPAVVGNGVQPVFEEQIVDGVSALVEVGETSLFEFVQASKDDTEIYNILARYERGDVGALSKSQGVFADVVGMPTNLAEAKASIIKFESMFENLPAEEKAKFNNNVNEFLMAVATAEPAPVEKPIEKSIESDGDVDA